MISRLRLDAGLYEPAPPRKPGTLGRPRVKGARLPSLLDRLADPATAWHRIRVEGWYGRLGADSDELLFRRLADLNGERHLCGHAFKEGGVDPQAVEAQVVFRFDDLQTRRR